MITYIVFGVIGACIGGAALDEFGGALLGFFIGFLAAAVGKLKQRVAETERRLNDLLARPADREAEPVRTETRTVRDIEPEEPDTPSVSPRRQAITPPSPPPPAPSAEALPSERKENEPAKILSAVKAFFTQGNVVVRIGVIVLFFGVAFLLKYAADRNVFPIEFRLAGVAAAGIALITLGWRLRGGRRGYGLVIQGGGVGILYLTLFAAARLYRLIPLELCFFLMVALVVLSGLLAVLQDALALAAFGAAGGFLAPVLTSSGGGSHVMLFSYYALLNAGILGIAWRKSWRVLNLIGFFFTFGIMTLWGVEHYRSEHFRSVEFFLILFFLFYALLSILFALRQPPRLKGYVDGTLVFGLPIVAFGLQTQLVKHTPYGLAVSALALAAFYILTASFLWKKEKAGLKLLTEAFLALGVAFGTLAIPLALSGFWTAAAWAMEGAALVWIGVRQGRVTARCAGLLLQFGAGVSLFRVMGWGGGDLLFINGRFLSGLLVSLSGLFSSYYLEAHEDRLSPWEKKFYIPMLAWGLIWWFGAGLSDIEACVSHKNQRAVMILHTVVSFYAMGWTFHRFNWRAVRYPAACFLIILWGVAIGLLISRYGSHLFIRWEALAWCAAFAVQFYLLRRFENHWRERITRIWHVGSLCLLVFVLSWECGWSIHSLVAGQRVWGRVAWGLIPCTAVWLLLRWGERLSWPVRRFHAEYLGWGPAVILAYAGLWEVWASHLPGNPSPLPYLPVLNPLDLSQVFGLLTMIFWLRENGRRGWCRLSPHALTGLRALVAMLAFIWMNAALARAVHFFGMVAFTRHAMMRSVLFQASVSILWTVTSLAAMAAATRKGVRVVWFAGAGLLAVVVVKLFLVDLDKSGTVARIVSFLVVGGLMLVVGYLSPLPPRSAEKGGDTNAAD